MIVLPFIWFKSRRERDLIRARFIREAAYREATQAQDRGDTRRQHLADAKLRQATHDVLRLECGR
jgi:hypothetical protein